MCFGRNRTEMTFGCPLTRYTVRMGGIVSVDWSLGDPLYDDHVCKGVNSIAIQYSMDFSIGFSQYYNGILHSQF